MLNKLVTIETWLYIIAFFRLFSAINGYFGLDKLKLGLYNRKPHELTPLAGRLMAVWTLLTCAICVFAAQNINNRQVLQLALLSFYAAAGFFILELLVYKTVGATRFLFIVIAAGPTIVWLQSLLK